MQYARSVETPNIVLSPTYPNRINDIIHVDIIYTTEPGKAIINIPSNVPAPFPPLKL